VEAGPVLHTVAVGAWPVALAVDAQAGPVFVVNHSTPTTLGSVCMLDTGTGAVLRTDPLASDAVAVHERAGRVLVADAGPTPPSTCGIPAATPPYAPQARFRLVNAVWRDGRWVLPYPAAET